MITQVTIIIRILSGGTQSENIQQCLRKGRLFKNKTFLEHQAKPLFIKEAVVKDYKQGIKLKDISQTYKVSIHFISVTLKEYGICRNRIIHFNKK